MKRVVTMRRLILGIVMCMSFAAISSRAESITIGESGFEGAPARGGGKSVPPWKRRTGVSTINIESYSILGTSSDAVPGGGIYCVYMNSTNDSIYQVLSTNLAANTIYTLSAVAIDRSNETFRPSELRLGYVPGTDNGTTGADTIANDFFGEYLLTATVLTNTIPVNAPIPSSSNGTTDPDDGYVTWASTFTTGSSPSGEGYPIRIEIVTFGATQSLFDNVTLSSEPVPSPAGTMFLFE